MSIKDTTIIEKSAYKDDCCNAFGCFNQSTEKLDVSAGKFGVISLNVCSKCIDIFKSEPSSSKKIEVTKWIFKISINNVVTLEEIWTDSYLIDKIFNDLVDGQKDQEYIKQFIDKFHYFRIKAPNVFFLIDLNDLNKDTTRIQLEICIRNCKTPYEKRVRLDGILTDVIARIAKQAQPLILSQTKYENIEYVKTAINETREIVSLRWKLVNY